MKIMNKADIIRKGQVEHILTEHRVLCRISHPFIVKLHYAFQTPSQLYLVLDFAGGGELFFHLSRLRMFSERMTTFYAAEIACALNYLHELDIIYRDLKPENILLDCQGHVLLADFGLAKEGVEEVHQGAHSLCGTPQYLSPEVLSRQGHGTAVDWWNLGMVCFEMLTGLPPWYSKDSHLHLDRQQLHHHQHHRYAPLVFPRYVSQIARDFIGGLLRKDPKTRLGSGGWAEISSHPFFGGIDWCALVRREVRPPYNPCRLSKSGSGQCATPGEEGSAETMPIAVPIPIDTRNFDKAFTSQPIDSTSDAQFKANRHLLERIDTSDALFPGYIYGEEPAIMV